MLDVVQPQVVLDAAEVVVVVVVGVVLEAHLEDVSFLVPVGLFELEVVTTGLPLRTVQVRYVAVCFVVVAKLRLQVLILVVPLVRRLVALPQLCLCSDFFRAVVKVIVV